LLLPPFVDVTIALSHETNESGFRDAVRVKYVARKNESRWEMGGYCFRLTGPSFGKGREEGGISCEMINVEWFVYAVRGVRKTRTATCHGLRISQSSFSAIPWLAGPILVG